MTESFQPRHINAQPDDLQGNNGIGRYVFLPGSDGRAKAISEYFNHCTVKHHPRGHHLYLGTITHKGKNIDVASIASGMGCPSMEIILHELFHLGAKRFLRVGTAGSLQPTIVNIGDIVNVQASVRDEQTTTDYAPLALPAIASFELISAVVQASQQLDLPANIHTGIVHCKSSLYAREFFTGPKSSANKLYNKVLKQCGVLATEMETAALFIQSQIYNSQLRQQYGLNNSSRVLWGALLGVIAVPTDHHASVTDEQQTISNVIQLAIETIKILDTHYK